MIDSMWWGAIGLSERSCGAGGPGSVRHCPAVTTVTVYSVSVSHFGLFNIIPTRSTLPILLSAITSIESVVQSVALAHSCRLLPFQPSFILQEAFPFALLL